MTETYYAKGITAQNLRAFLELWSLLAADIEDAKKTINECSDRLFKKGDDQFSWCHLYEIPAKNLVSTMFNDLMCFVPQDQLSSWYMQMANCPGNLGELPNIYGKVSRHFNERPNPTNEDLEVLRPSLPTLSASFIAMEYSLYCVLYYGCFLNDLIARVRADDDEALFDAIRVDPMVVGCRPIIERISKARRLQDKDFLNELKKTQSGVSEKRKQINFQKMRLVLKVLADAGATRLSDRQLHELFIEELKLYTANSKGGGVEKALRKFTDTYMKKNATT